MKTEGGTSQGIAVTEVSTPISDHVTVLAGSILGGACSPAGYTQGPLVEDAFKGQLQIEKNGEDILLRDMTGKARILLVPY